MLFKTRGLLDEAVDYILWFRLEIQGAETFQRSLVGVLCFIYRLRLGDKLKRYKMLRRLA